MIYQKSITSSVLAICLAYSGLIASKAEVQTTQTTTTITVHPTSSVVNFPATGRFILVDPVTGQVHGSYDPQARLREGATLRSGVVIVNEIDGAAVGFVDQSGNVVDVRVSPASQSLLVSIDTRRQDLNHRIDEALNKGILSPTQAASFRAELDQLAADEERERQANGIVSYQKAIMLGYGLNRLSEKLVPLTTYSFQPVIAPQFVVLDGRLTLLDSINYRKHHLETRCDDEYSAGRLSQKQVSELKSHLGKISSTQIGYVKHGALSSSKERKLSAQLDRVESEMNNDVAQINRKRSRIGIRAD